MSLNDQNQGVFGGWYGNGYGGQVQGRCRFFGSLEVMTVLQPYQANT